MSGVGGPAAGWYPDPEHPDQIRFWDGVDWTDHRAPFDGGPTAGSEAVPGPAPVPAAVADPHGLGDVGRWLRDSLAVPLGQLPAYLVMLYAVPAVALVVMLLVAYPVIEPVVFTADTVTGGPTGASALRLLTVPLVWLATLYGTLAYTHAIHAAHVGVPAPLARSALVGLRRFLPVAGYLLLFWLAAFVAMFLAVFIPALLATVAGPAAVLLLGVTFALLAIAGAWISVRLTFFTVAAVVAGARPVATSWRMTAGRFWPVAGRALLVGIVAYAVMSFGQLVFSAVAPVVDPEAETLMVTAEGRLATADGEPVEEFAVADLLPSQEQLVVGALLAWFATSAGLAVFSSGLAALYLRAGGPSDHPVDAVAIPS
ncbi:MAG: DUF2510 domain-containing protein [Acidimicrobiales bacterium]